MAKSDVNYEIGEKHIPVSKLTDQNRLQNFIAGMCPDLPLVGNRYYAGIPAEKAEADDPHVFMIECPLEWMRSKWKIKAFGEIYDDMGYLAIRFTYFDESGEQIWKTVF